MIMISFATLVYFRTVLLYLIHTNKLQQYQHWKVKAKRKKSCLKKYLLGPSLCLSHFSLETLPQFFNAWLVCRYHGFSSREQTHVTMQSKNSETAKRQQTLNQIIISWQRWCNGQWQSGVYLMHAFRVRCKHYTASNTIHYWPIPEFSQCDNVVIHTCTSSENCGYISCQNVILMMTACFTQSVERKRKQILLIIIINCATALQNQLREKEEAFWLFAPKK